MDKKKYSLIGFGVLAAAAVIILAVFGLKGGGSGSTGSDASSLSALTVITSSAEEEASLPEQSSSAADNASADEISSAPETVQESQPDSSAAESSPDPQKEYKQYSFRSKKLFDSHYEKHGSEFGSITQEEYLQLANDLLNSDSPSILNKTEKEDGDDVFFDTDTGYFLVLSTDGYIRTFFIPDKGIDYYNRQ